MLDKILRKLRYKNPYLESVEEFYNNVAIELNKSGKDSSCKSAAIDISSFYKNSTISPDNLENFLTETDHYDAIFFAFMLRDWSFDGIVPKRIVHIGVLDPEDPHLCYHRLDNGVVYNNDDNFVIEPLAIAKERRPLYENSFAGRDGYNYLFDTRFTFLR